MNSSELLRVLSQNRHTKGIHYAVTSSDRLPPTPLQRPATLIVNADSSNKPGSHWLVFYFPRKGPAEFFDSMGHSPQFYHQRFKNYLIVNGPVFLHNTKRIPDFNSDFCGEYCLQFIIGRSRGMTFCDFLHWFGQNYAYNDYKLQQYVKRWNM